jgi:polyhydroxybutyrate depolymerase
MARWSFVAAVAVACFAQVSSQGLPSCLEFNTGFNKTCITHEGLNRCWLTYTPRALDNKTGKAPAVLLLHGLTGCADFIAQQTGLLAEAERRGFHIVMPQGTFNLNVAMPPGQEGLANASSWDAGPCCGAAAVRKPDDSGFLAKVVDQSVLDLPINSNRFYVYGHSNGAAMAARFAVEYPGKVTAVAAISFYLLVQATNAYTTKVPYIAVHGTNDRTVGFEAAPGPAGAIFVGANASAATFSRMNNCAKGPLSQTLTVSDKNYTRISYGGCDAPRNSEVALAVVPGGTHQPFPLSGITQLDDLLQPDRFDSSKLACDFLFDYERDGSFITRFTRVSPSPDYDATASPTTASPTTAPPTSPTTAPPTSPTTAPPTVRTTALVTLKNDAQAASPVVFPAAALALAALLL